MLFSSSSFFIIFFCWIGRGTVQRTKQSPQAKIVASRHPEGCSQDRQQPEVQWSPSTLYTGILDHRMYGSVGGARGIPPFLSDSLLFRIPICFLNVGILRWKREKRKRNWTQSGHILSSTWKEIK
ncbi:hypothetical protein BCR43DRAFT_118333 [Syncephalastrum racemosum]|uniref:Secreted protein n=1 Tax=Syncephalastrum racemosum TaxID=13706 RepID=A0A1X2GZF3_SYNRA|nr:hypothetical protein BCR43DRAFT_118333 [Syncephalastrum racemosum]